MLFASPIGIGFCRLGKAIWRFGTFGLTDMAKLYPENKAPMLFRIFGIFLILWDIWFTTAWITQGPESFFVTKTF